MVLAFLEIWRSDFVFRKEEESADLVLFRKVNLQIRFGFDGKPWSLKPSSGVKEKNLKPFSVRNLVFADTCLFLDNVQLIFANGCRVAPLLGITEKRRKGNESNGCIGKHTTID